MKRLPKETIINGVKKFTPFFFWTMCNKCKHQFKYEKMWRVYKETKRELTYTVTPGYRIYDVYGYVCQDCCKTSQEAWNQIHNIGVNKYPWQTVRNTATKNTATKNTTTENTDIVHPRCLPATSTPPYGPLLGGGQIIWRLLNIGEKILKGDEYYDHKKDMWVVDEKYSALILLRCYHVPHRRKWDPKDTI